MLSGLRVLGHVITKEFLQIRRDRRMIPLIFVAPVLQIVIFGFAVNTEVRHVPMVLLDQDRSSASRELTQRFVSSGYFELVGVEESLEAVEPWLTSGRAQVALIIGHGLGKAAFGQTTARIQILADGSDASATMVALGYSAGIINGRMVELLSERAAAAIGADEDGPQEMPRVGRIRLIPRVLFNPDLRSRWFYVPAVLAMVLMIMTMMLSAMGVVREKEIGTMEQLIVTPIRPWQLIVGKLCPFGMIGFLQIFLVTGVAVFGFGVLLRGSFLLLIALTQLFLLNTLSLGLLLSTLVRTQQQAMIVAGPGVMVPMVYLSGLIFPIENMPHAMQLVTYFIPLRYYATIIRGIFLKGSGIGVLWPEALALLIMGSALLGLAALRFRKRLD